MLDRNSVAASAAAPRVHVPGTLKTLHFIPKAKRIIYLFKSGAPSHLDLFDPKPGLKPLTNSELPGSVRMGQRITGMTSGQKQLLVVGSPFAFKPCGKCGVELSELLPNIGSIADDICVIRSLQQLNRIQLGHLGDPEIATHIENYELAYRMQTSVPELMDISKEPKEILESYGAEPGKASFANNCLGTPCPMPN